MKLIVNDTSVVIADVAEGLLSNSVNLYPIAFEFSDVWDEYTKTAVFQKGDTVIEVALSDNKCVIPWEVLRSRGWLKIGIRGVTGDKVKPTLWSELIPVDEGVCEGDESKEPTKTHYQAVLESLKSVEKDVEELKNGEYENLKNLVDGKADGSIQSVNSNATNSNSTATGFNTNSGSKAFKIVSIGSKPKTVELVVKTFIEGNSEQGIPKATCLYVPDGVTIRVGDTVKYNVNTVLHDWTNGSTYTPSQKRRIWHIDGTVYANTNLTDEISTLFENGTMNITQTGYYRFLSDQYTPSGWFATTPPFIQDFTVVETEKKYTLNSVEGLAVGMKCIAHLSNAGQIISTITAIKGNEVYVDNYEIISLSTDKDDPENFWCTNYLIIIGHNELGDIDVGYNAHTEGRNTFAQGADSHAEGNGTKAVGKCGHAEGNGTIAGYSAHSEGRFTEATGVESHAEGYLTKARGLSSHAEGRSTIADGMGSHSEGFNTVAQSDFQRVSGKWNIVDGENKFAEIVGNGKDGYSRSNARTLDWEGNAHYAGEVYVKGEKRVATIDEVNALFDELKKMISEITV